MKRQTPPNSISSLSGHKLLNGAQEQQLGKAARGGDNEARDALTLHNLRLAINIAKQYQGRGVALDDLVQEGFSGLLRAVDRYDPDMLANGNPVRFSTYATYWIKQAILLAIARDTTIRVPHSAATLAGRYAKAARQLQQADGLDHSPEQIAAAAGLDDDQSGRVRDVHSAHRFEQPMGYRDPISEVATVMPEPDLDRAEQLAKVRAVMRTGLPRLEREVIKMRFGLGGPRLTLQEIGDRMQYTREWVRQTEAKALRRLRQMLTESDRPPDAAGGARKARGTGKYGRTAPR